MLDRTVLLLLTILCLITSPVRAEDVVDFTTQIRPLLASRCLQCHGPDEKHREGGLRLDVRSDAVAELESGEAAIVPGKPEQSALVERIFSVDEAIQMPPAELGKPLTAAEKALLKTWVAQGAPYAKHWAFVPPARGKLPEVKKQKWTRNAIDSFTLSRMEESRVTPAAEANRWMLIRRLSLDLTGLPPTPAEAKAFVEDDSPEAYEKAVDRLLASPHFGERLAMFWLDAARYSDTDGFQADATRSNWPWRDWVIDAFNQNTSFDQFTLEQFAGDLLPNATAEQKLATCFHRNHMANGEGGRDPAESRIDYVIDRINTTGTVWLGLTLGCTQCHSHKYDPISHREYYQLFAFFNNIEEDGRAGGGAKPFLSYKPKYTDTPLKQAETWLKTLQVREAKTKSAAEVRFESWLKMQLGEVKQGYRDWHPLTVQNFDTRSGTELAQQPDHSILASGPDPHHEDYRLQISGQSLTRNRITGLKLEVLPHEAHTNNGLSRSDTGHFILSDIKLRVSSTGTQQISDVKIVQAVADYSANPGKNGGYGNVAHTLDDDPRNGWASFGAKLTEARTAVFALDTPLELAADDVLIIELQQRALQGRHNIGRFRLSVTDQPGNTPRSLKPSPLEDLTAAAPETVNNIDAKLKDRLRQHFLAGDAETIAMRDRVARAQRQLNEFKKGAGNQRVMVLSERKDQRKTHILKRGVWNQPGEEVRRDVPTVLHEWPKNTATDRIGLARWLTDRQNPLTARVFVNHLWRLYFGAGLVRTPDDFGLQGEPPTHPQLLDWLAVEFMESGWDIKRIVKLMVMSATYRQTSDVAADVRAVDPQNRLFARAGRYRMPAWMIRDAALQSSGLLNPITGGPPVRAYQPHGVWADITMGRFHYEPSVGPARYRRTVYTFWRRSASPAFLFDSAQRRVCEVATSRTNTPLHALTLLNDVTMIEAGRALAMKTHANGQPLKKQLQTMWQAVVVRPASDHELGLLKTQYEKFLKHYQNQPADAERFLTIGEAPPLPEINRPHLAALSVVATMLFNLDETLNRQ